MDLSSDKIEEFYLLREEDESGVSGTGVVARGVKLASGKCILEWQTFHSSIAIYENLESLNAIHGHGGKTKVVMGSPFTKKRKKHA
jgi:hypothetical protein